MKTSSRSQKNICNKKAIIYTLLYKSSHRDTLQEKLINVYRQPPHILLIASTHATSFDQYWPSSGIKCMIILSAT